MYTMFTLLHWPCQCHHFDSVNAKVLILVNIKGVPWQWPHLLSVSTKPIHSFYNSLYCFIELYRSNHFHGPIRRRRVICMLYCGFLHTALHLRPVFSAVGKTVCIWLSLLFVFLCTEIQRLIAELVCCYDTKQTPNWEFKMSRCHISRHFRRTHWLFRAICFPWMDRGTCKHGRQGAGCSPCFVMKELRGEDDQRLYKSVVQGRLCSGKTDKHLLDLRTTCTSCAAPKPGEKGERFKDSCQ